MDVLRNGFDGLYNLIKPVVFKVTRKNAKVAHRLFVNSLKGLRICGLSDLVLDNTANYINPDYIISNAAGLVKNAEIDPRDMRLLGFDRVVVGTVTGDYWKGNSGQTIWRFPKGRSLVNCEGFPGVGAEEVALRLYKYGNHEVPLTVNLMSTPGKNGDAVLYDLEKTVLAVRDVSYVDRFELNPSCSNTKNKCGSLDARVENNARLGDMIRVVRDTIHSWQKLYVKISPDFSNIEYDNIIEVGEGHGVNGYTTTNATTKHDPKYITEKLEEGAGSGDAVWDASVRTQKYFADRVGGGVELTACGGIISVERMRERCVIGNCNEVQLFVPLVFEGPGLLRKLRVGR